jgi:hypothetical protein
MPWQRSSEDLDGLEGDRSEMTFRPGIILEVAQVPVPTA